MIISDWEIVKEVNTVWVISLPTGESFNCSIDEFAAAIKQLELSISGRYNLPSSPKVEKETVHYPVGGGHV